MDLTRGMAKKPFKVTKAAKPMVTTTTNDFKLPAPNRTKDLEPQPEPQTMPQPNIKPPNVTASQGAFLAGKKY
jgi:hypothetical protein